MNEDTFVVNATGHLQSVLLCSPSHFQFQPINEITRRVLANGESPDIAAMQREHAGFVDAYEAAGVKVELIQPDPALPYMVYARDFGACLAEGVLIGRFREPIRQGEELLFARKLQELGVPIVGRISRGTFEGGDFWLLDETTVVQGVAARTDWEGVRNAAEILEPLGYTVRGVQIDSRFLHLDMAFNIVAPGIAVAAIDALPDFFLRMLRKRKFELVETSAQGVFKHYCNVQALGDDRVLTFEANKDVNARLRALGLDVITADIWNILKGGGGPHCMTFPLRRSSTTSVVETVA